MIDDWLILSFLLVDYYNESPMFLYGKTAAQTQTNNTYKQHLVYTVKHCLLCIVYFIVPTGKFFPWESGAAFPEESQLQQSHHPDLI